MNIESLKKFLNGIVNRGGSISIDDPGVIERFTSDPDFPYLVSFPRTGSHWLRVMLELYFKRPTLVRAFYYKNSTNYLLYHTHDIELDTFRRNVIYLYRDPIPTIYSQTKYYDIDLLDEKSVLKWAQVYGKHLSKWLDEENFTATKTILKYERLKSDLTQEFGKAIIHLGGNLDEIQINKIANFVTREEIARKTTHDENVINKSVNYEEERERFSKRYSELINNIVFGANEKLESYF